MQLAALRVEGRAAPHGKTVQGAPAEEDEGQCGEIEMRRPQNRLPAYEPEFADAQEIAARNDPRAACSQADVSFPPIQWRCRKRLFATRLAQHQAFPQGHEPKGDADALPEGMQKGQPLVYHNL